MSHGMRSRFLSAGFFALVAILCISLSGCASGRLRTFHEPDGTPKPFKRRARYSSVDYVHRFRAVAYTRWGALSRSGLSMDQKMALVDHGNPDFVRRPFRSQYSETTEEWVYLNKSLLMQFVEGDTVFTGPVTDLEQILIERGYPRFCTITDIETPPRMSTFVYKPLIGGHLETYSFADGQLISKAD